MGQWNKIDFPIDKFKKTGDKEVINCASLKIKKYSLK